MSNDADRHTYHPAQALPATDAQVRAIWRLGLSTHNEKRAYLQKTYGTSEPGQLTRRQASEVIDNLKIGAILS
jgi:hypothetical protein